MAAEAAFPGGADTVIIANGYRSIDALSANYVAGQLEAPILLTDTDTVPQSTLDAITALGATNVVIFGDEVSVSADAQAELTAAGLTITDTIAGDDRFETAADAYESVTTPAKTVFVARGDFYGTDQVAADALAAGPLSYNGIPVLLTNADSLPDSTAAALTDGGVTKVIYLGTNISDTVKAAVTAAAPGSTSEVIGGADRTSTAQMLADSTYGKALYGNTAASLANGYKVDALAAGPWAAITKTPILLTYGTDALGDGTTKYLTDHAATLTSATVFGDTASVPAALAASAKTSGGGDVVASTGVTVTAFAPADNTYTYGDATTKAPAIVTYASTDLFTVDGLAASLGVFEANLSVGDKVTATANTPSAGVTTYALTNVATSAITAGPISNVDTAANTFDIIDPVTGTALRSFNYGGAQTFYTVGGTNSTLTNFEQEIAAGDSVSVSGAGTAASPYTVALTKGSLTGTVASLTAGSNLLTVKTAGGATLGVTYLDTDTFRVDGSAVAVGAFEGAGVVTPGDTVTVTRAGGAYTIVLTNAAATPYTGIAPSGQTAAALQVFVGTATTPTTAFNATTSNAKLTVDGSLVDTTEFNAALTAGDELTIQQPDGQIDTVGSVALVNKPLSGKVGAVVVGTSFAVRNAADSANLQVVNYTGVGPYTTNTSQTYFVNGTAVPVAQFSSELSLVANGSKTATASATDNGTVTEYRLTTAANSASATVSGTITAAANTTNPDTIVIPFSKPVYFGASPAAGDFAVTKGGAAVAAVPTVSPNVIAGAGNSLTLTFADGTFASGDTLTVQLTAQGAAKIFDANGVAATAQASATTGIVAAS